MRTFFLMLGLPDLAMSQMLLIVALVWACAFALAWIADAILGDGAFGVLLNTTMLIIGAVIGTLLWRKFSYGAMALQAQTLAFVATGSGIAMLIICGVLRRWI
jgi:uncharacterized membrane protein YeaQ/YmgE (transglycosylase-associated protein family)